MKFKTLYVFSLSVNKNGTKRNLLFISYVVYGQLYIFRKGGFWRSSDKGKENGQK